MSPHDYQPVATAHPGPTPCARCWMPGADPAHHQPEWQRRAQVRSLPPKVR